MVSIIYLICFPDDDTYHMERCGCWPKQLWVYLSVCVWVGLCVCLHMCAGVCVFVCVHVCMHIHLILHICLCVGGCESVCVCVQGLMYLLPYASGRVPV